MLLSTDLFFTRGQHELKEQLWPSPIFQVQSLEQKGHMHRILLHFGSIQFKLYEMMNMNLQNFLMNISCSTKDLKSIIHKELSNCLVINDNDCQVFSKLAFCQESIQSSLPDNSYLNTTSSSLYYKSYSFHRFCPMDEVLWINHYLNWLSISCLHPQIYYLIPEVALQTITTCYLNIYSLKKLRYVVRIRSLVRRSLYGLIKSISPFFIKD
ncbi:unnamed protein product [Paramecium primaurelia]|uniref:Uncharacterized protein n=1 Tax=Paramecium primaurelia TaxID=5886 RepID=A0A8S1QQB3_PARPR|nr:unnamed protein product [Paramecium primaurelia]